MGASQAQSTLEGGRLRGHSERKKKTFLHLITAKFCEGSFFWPLKEDPETSQHTLQCPPSAANTTHVSDNFAQDYIWYILRTKVENWESFVYHNFYFYYFLSLAKLPVFYTTNSQTTLKWEILLHTCHKSFLTFLAFWRWWPASTANIVKRHTTHHEKRKLEPHRGSMEMKEFVENSASQRGECFESVLPQKGSLVGAED